MSESKIIFLDCFSKKILEDEMMKFSKEQFGDCEILKYENKQTITEVINFYKGLLKEKDKNYIISGSFYSQFVDDFFSLKPKFTPFDLSLFEDLNLFYFFIDLDEQPKKDLKKYNLFKLLYHCSKLPVKIKIDQGFNGLERAFQDFKKQYNEFVVKNSKLLFSNNIPIPK